MTQRRTGDYDYDRFVHLLETYEDRTRHIFGKLDNGRLVPLTDNEAHQARRNGVKMELPETAMLSREDGNE